MKFELLNPGLMTNAERDATFAALLAHLGLCPVRVEEGYVMLVQNHEAQGHPWAKGHHPYPAVLYPSK